MSIHEATPRVFTLGSGLAVLGVGALLLPLLPSWGQQPPATPPAGLRPAAREQAGNPISSPPGLSEEIQRIQADLDRARRILEERSLELRRLIEQTQAQAAGAGHVQTRNSGGLGAIVAQAPPSALPVQGSAGVEISRGAAPDMDKRLRNVERKLDTLIQMMRQNVPQNVPPTVTPGGLYPPVPTPRRNNAPSTPPVGNVPLPPQPNVPGTADSVPLTPEVPATQPRGGIRRSSQETLELPPSPTVP